MELRDISRLLIKCSGLVMIVWAVSTIPTQIRQAAAYEAAEDAGVTIATALGPVAVPILVGLALFWAPGAIANRIVSGGPIAEARDAFRRLEAGALLVLGVYLVSQALADAVYYYAKLSLYFSYIQRQGWNELSTLLPEDFGGMVAAAVEGLIGAALILGSRTFARLAGRLRDGGRP